MVIYKKSFRRYATSRGRMAVKTNYRHILITDTNLGRTRLVARY